MDLHPFFKSVIDQDTAPVVICGIDDIIVYMNPAAAEAEAHRGGYALVGKSLLDCHNEESRKAIKTVREWFMEDKSHNIVHTFHNSRVNKDVYMIALRDEAGGLIGYYEKHEFRDPETMPRYKLD